MVLGILAHLYLKIPLSNEVWMMLSLIFITIFIILMFTKKGRFFLFILPFLFLLILGLKLADAAQGENTVFFRSGLFGNDTIRFVGEIDEIPAERPKTIRLVVKVREVKNGEVFYPAGSKVLLYVQKSKDAFALKPGEMLVVQSSLRQIQAPLNPHGFDFRTYYNDQGIYFQSYVDSLSYRVMKNVRVTSLRQAGLAIKHWLLNTLKSSGLTKDAYAICSALLTGFDDDIDKNVMESFAHSGTLHILSVSGLHVGIIYTLLNFMISGIDPRNRYRKSGFVFITAILWFFALITGFSAPVLRAVIMFTLFGIGRLFFRHRSFNSLNILFVSAFILLLADPLLIRNIGFLLSYSALFGILYFYPVFEKWYVPQNRILKYTWQSACLSVSATITTLPVTLAVFHQFPIMFVLANLIVVPASFLLLVLAVFVITGIKFFVTVVNNLTRALMGVIEWFNVENVTYVDHIDFTITDAVLVSVLLIMLVTAIKHRTYKHVVWSMFVLLIWQLYGIKDSYVKKTQSELVVYVTNGQCNVSVKRKNVVLLNVFDSLNYQMNLKPNITSYNYPEKHVMNFNYVKGAGISMFISSNKKLTKWPLDKPITHLLVINNGLPADQFFKETNLTLVMADASNTRATVNRLKKLCEKYRLQFCDLRETGAFVKKM